MKIGDEFLKHIQLSSDIIPEYSLYSTEVAHHLIIITKYSRKGISRQDCYTYYFYRQTKSITLLYTFYIDIVWNL